MSDLKTLKDLSPVMITGDGENTRDYFDDKLVDREVLRQEAIKWVKELDNKQDYETKEKIDLAHTVSWIKHFFNLTEEDLK